MRPWNAPSKRDDAIAIGLPVHGVELARGLDRAFHRLGAGIGEEHMIGEALLAQPVGELLLLGHAEQVGDVDRLLCLRGDCGRDLRVRVTERVHGDAGGKVEIALAIGGGKPGALAVIEREVNAREGRQKMRGAHEISRCCWPGTIETYPLLPIARRPEMKRAASPGGTLEPTLLLAVVPVNMTAPATRLPRRFARMAISWGKRRTYAHPWNPDSCAGVTRYCSFVTGRYDISCGGLSPELLGLFRACVRRPSATGRGSRIPRGGDRTVKWSRGQ